MPSTAADAVRAELDAIARESWGKLLALLIHRFRDIETAEDGLQEAMLAATSEWPRHGMPNNPPGWLLRTASNRILDRLRRRKSLARKLEQIECDRSDEIDDETMDALPDERLRLIFTCCHPALDESARVALTLQTLCGLSTQQVANAFLVASPTMAQRLVRAKRKIKTAGIPYELPPARLLPERITTVLAVVYFIFNEGYRASTPGELIDRNLCDEAIRLAQVIVGLLDDEAEAWGLLALMLLHYSRFDARLDSTGCLIDLEAQDRSAWRWDLIETADKILSAVLIKGRTGPYQLQAAISAVHAHAPSFDRTDWKQIVLLYHRLAALDPNPVIRLNLAVALSYAERPETALSYLDQLPELSCFVDYHPYFAARADLLRRAGQSAAAARCYRQAIDLCDNEVETAYLERRLSEVSTSAD